jgi:hypothetical protein
MEAIKDTVRSVIKGLESRKSGFSDADPCSWLKKVLTKKELGHIKLNYFKKGMLAVTVDSAAWMYSFNLKKEKLLEQLKRECAQVKDLRFRIGDISEKSKS